MFINGTRCKVIDNSGALEAEIFGRYKQPINRKTGVMSKRGKRVSVVGDVVMVAIKKVEPNKNIKKGNVSKAILVKSVRKEKKASDACHIKFFTNAIVLLNNGDKKKKKKNYNLQPIATSVKGQISSKVSIKEVTNMSKGII
jgi:large subunit ribosomal protein L14